MENKRRVVLFGPGPQFKGGISNYNTSLAKAMDALGAEVHIVSWTQQYPAIIPRDFIDRSSKHSLIEGTQIQVQYLTNYNNPLSWAKTVRAIKALKPEMVIFQWAIALQGLPMGWMARRLKHSGIEVIFDLHLVVQKESSSVDRFFTRYGLKTPGTFITHAYKTVDELKSTFPNETYEVNESGERHPSKKTVIKLYHPIYDLYKPDPQFDREAEKAKMGLKKHVFLYFGFIRKYKGLHQAIEAFEALRKERDDVSFLVVGESFWNTLDKSKLSTKIKSKLFGFAKKLVLKNADNEQNYNPFEALEQREIPDIKIYNQFVPNEEVHRYFQVADAIVLFYLTATPSGVESLSYNFKLPVLASRVGHFPETIQDGFNGYLANDRDIADMTACMRKFIENPIPSENVAKSAEKMSWENYAKTILQIP
ncbi:MAG: glycosyltransferase family 4 protein [Bacteroidota bacterium]|nr:glycosyltransferase family 4 protein [Bacteroidota bacterium]MDX5431018.1 glycosyltransferase family 4 protein [Bacteroidota bacterium]MDX5469769.1 glycosyltransferase family 4 protein [Bacteroidota bacterium]